MWEKFKKQQKPKKGKENKFVKGALLESDQCTKSGLFFDSKLSALSTELTDILQSSSFYGRQKM
jgi:hypothetical protein